MGKRSPICLQIGADVAYLRMPSKYVLATGTGGGSGVFCTPSLPFLRGHLVQVDQLDSNPSM